MAALLCVSSVGCASWSKQNSVGRVGEEASFFSRMLLIGKKSQKEEPEPYPKPVKMAATWTPDTLMQTGRTPTRGFGGRVFFYNERSQPVPVDGTLVVHGFDDSVQTDKRQLKRFEFTPEQFTRHFSQSDLGASYSVWIPWDAVGGDQRRISLVASFKTVQGDLIQGIPATILLPGKTNVETPESEMARFSPQYQRYRKASGAASSSTGLVTTTITRRRGLDRAEKRAVDVPSPTDQSDQVVISVTPSMDLTPSRYRPQRIGKRAPTVMPASAIMSSNEDN